MSEENDGILENLPRSRPGVRSEKRASGATPAKPKSKAAPKAAPAKPKPKPKPRAKRPAAAPPPPPPPPQAEPPERPAHPIGVALKAGEAVARTGIKVAGRVAGEVIRRLPRP